MPKMHLNTFGGPDGELKRSPRPYSRNQGDRTFKGREVREGMPP